VTQRIIDIAEPVVGDHEVVFAWKVTPRHGLYERESFVLRFPEDVDISNVAPGLWLRLALMVLHIHWPLLRPCRVRVPATLEPGEAELWLRLSDAAQATLEAHSGGDDFERSVELVTRGPRLPPGGPAAHDAESSPPPGIVSCFSGGRDGLVQAAMLSELGERPTLVTVTAPCPWDHEHDTRRRRQVLDELPRRREVELIEVYSDMRSAWNNTAAHRYNIGVNELTDTLLWLAGAIGVAAARRARLVLMASETEVQTNARRAGTVVQARHFVYSAATHRALAAAIAGSGIGIGSLTNSLRQFQLQRLLSDRYGDLRDLQYSCWNAGVHETACSACGECRGIALNLAAAGVDPAIAGIDLVTLLLSQAGWEPGERHVAHTRPDDELLPMRRGGRAHEMQELRSLMALTPDAVRDIVNGTRTVAEREHAVAVLQKLQTRAARFELEPEPGYQPGYLELLDEPGLRAGVKAIADEHFSPAPEDSYGDALRNTRLLARWITAPMGDAVQARRDTALDYIEALKPGPEPDLRPGPGGRIIRVAETLLDGNELAYVTEAVRANWVSSAGSRVREFEGRFAEVSGVRYAVACSSGTAALHLAVAATGIGPGDEVILPTFTMVATANAARYVGADPVLVDADPVSWNLDVAKLRAKLTRRTRAIIAVHLYGQPADMDAVRSFADRNGLIVIEDAAEAHGARYHGARVGSLGDVGTFSLYGNKILTAGEGGVVTTDDRRIAELARELRDHAFSPERHFWHRRFGFNYRMTNLQAAVALAQTERLDTLVALRRTNADRYARALDGIDGIALGPQLEGGVCWMFCVLVDEARFGTSRDELREHLAACGVETRTLFVPMHMQPIYQQRFAGERYPVAERLGATGLYLPSGPFLSDDDIAYVADAVRSAAATSLAARPSLSGGTLN
jgi:perosamine synthetase